MLKKKTQTLGSIATLALAVLFGVASSVILSGCAATLHYPSYAKSQAEVLKAQAAADKAMYDALGSAIVTGDGETARMATFTTLVLGLTKKSGAIAPPKDKLNLDKLWPWAFGYGIATEFAGVSNVTNSSSVVEKTTTTTTTTGP